MRLTPSKLKLKLKCNRLALDGAGGLLLLSVGRFQLGSTVLDVLGNSSRLLGKS